MYSQFKMKWLWLFQTIFGPIVHRQAHRKMIMSIIGDDKTKPRPAPTRRQKWAIIQIFCGMTISSCADKHA